VKTLLMFIALVLMAFWGCADEPFPVTEIEGVVYDSSTRLPVSNVSISVTVRRVGVWIPEEAPPIQEVGHCSSNSSGEFRVSVYWLAEQHVLSTTVEGYKTASEILEYSNDIYLELPLDQLNENP